MLRIVEDHRKRLVEERNLNLDQKMIILWDVYCRHRDPDLLELIRNEYKHLIILFVPANLTEICQPLDIYFNSEFKVKLASLRNERVAESFEKWRAERVNNDEEEGGFKVDGSLAKNKVWFYTDIARTIAHMQTDEKKKKFRDIAFGDLKIAYNNAFQVSAVEKVALDNSGKYFKSVDGSPIDNTIERFSKSMTYRAIQAHEELATMEEFQASMDPTFFLRRRVHCLNQTFPGQVDSYTFKRNKNLARHQRLVFKVKYYFDTVGEGRAKKVLSCTKDELLNMLIVREIEDEGDEEESGDIEVTAPIGNHQELLPVVNNAT